MRVARPDEQAGHPPNPVVGQARTGNVDESVRPAGAVAISGGLLLALWLLVAFADDPGGLWPALPVAFLVVVLATGVTQLVTRGPASPRHRASRSGLARLPAE
jgi:hypothetical protein